MARYLSGLLLALAINASGGEQPVVRIIDHQPWSCLFAGQEYQNMFTLEPSGSFSGRMAWRVEVNNRIVANGEKKSSFGLAGPAQFETAFELPPLENGLVVEGKFILTITDTATDKVAARLEKKLHIFGRRPVIAQSAWQKHNKIYLFDPPGTTAQAFEDIELPFTAIHNPDALAAIKDGIIVIGAGLSWRDYRGLFGNTITAAAAGARVLCLAPAEGSTPLPGTQGAEYPDPSRMMFSGNDIITRFDKRFDYYIWPTDGHVSAGGFQLEGGRAGITGNIVARGQGWPWVEMHFPDGGQFLLCNFALIDKWEAGPVPRFLLVSILENMRKKGEKK